MAIRAPSELIKFWFQCFICLIISSPLQGLSIKKLAIQVDLSHCAHQADAFGWAIHHCHHDRGLIVHVQRIDIHPRSRQKPLQSGFTVVNTGVMQSSIVVVASPFVHLNCWLVQQKGDHLISVATCCNHQAGVDGSFLSDAVWICSIILQEILDYPKVSISTILPQGLVRSHLQLTTKLYLCQSSGSSWQLCCICVSFFCVFVYLYLICVFAQAVDGSCTSSAAVVKAAQLLWRRTRKSQLGREWLVGGNQQPNTAVWWGSHKQIRFEGGTAFKQLKIKLKLILLKVSSVAHSSLRSPQANEHWTMNIQRMTSCSLRVT